MKADPQAQRRLLDLQAIDTALTQLAHRRRTLPEHAELDALARELSALEDERVRAQVAVDDLDRDIARLERDVDQVRARKDKDQARLAAGSGPARELEALQHELASLTRRQTELEDAELELMEQRETAQAALDQVTGRIDSTRQRRAEVEQTRERNLAEIASEEQFKTSARAPLAGDLPADLVALYDKIRENSGGLAAALMRAGRCGGCRLELSATERGRIKAADPAEVVRCEDCRRIMVRTAESGL
ncbi:MULTISPECIES: C4-type zinc ribbon domain-containing protein [unclassified Solwaraspora]|uniref:zinc ribbon domain-containing protein n=1 Tax=unclassified Solwaraspora TaxID=2627926 RepID=UPI00248BB99F|nr:MULTISPECIES: C4-type zinc ribbon domain-containing protein [unclassified Solwaraspora]WBB95232.1 C4-type zinc ribbon domain-containing protein [Solwaraspora sp. WMMA2059]WBC20862.1 C4-type zinc ribbon domain-containing protein [Solwaraspora sp. WMMA2080]WJK37005.1 C4-type zinc ribbon domain-containing protein [Solwaraspora sp. WMMA2065]